MRSAFHPFGNANGIPGPWRVCWRVIGPRSRLVFWQKHLSLFFTKTYYALAAEVTPSLSALQTGRLSVFEVRIEPS